MTSQTPVWFITAASSGFGKYIALEALSRGHKVIASARSLSRISDLASKGADTVVLDVTSPLSEIQKVAQAANYKYGYVTHLVNAAGYILVGAVEELSPEEDQATFQTNVFGMINVIKAFLPHLRSSPGHRTISNFGSIASWGGGAGFALYAGTKWACSGISEALRAELAPFGIAVTVVEPGYFRTGFLRPDAQVQSAKTMDVYNKSAVGALRKRLEQVNNNQPGDVGKGAKVIVDVLTMTGVAEGREVPIRVVLGSDAPGVVRAKCESTLELLAGWDGITNVTDHE
ncbi:NAD(P)-binding protein [Ophiobolus disseminans]|uniref:NAD(P)-binding protein n=1 Tax=Ophiobolus disseminans TaxID=1469910 RepID=A0A6A6ZL70_9PLEO|nr:NAD(P)-binding protein [Ophiobolus disseminans]